MFLQIDLYLTVCFYGLLIIILCVLLGASTFLFCILVTIINWIFVPLHMCFLVTAPRILVIGVLTLHLNAFIFLVISDFINMCFHLIILNRLQRFPLLPSPKPPLLSSQIYSTPRCSPLIYPYHHNLLASHSIHPSLAHHHMHVYLTILLQVQVANQSSLPFSITHLLMLRQPLVLPLVLLIWPESKLLQTLPLLTILFLLSVLYLR